MKIITIPSSETEKIAALLAQFAALNVWFRATYTTDGYIEIKLLDN